MAHTKEGLVRYKVDGKFVYLPKRSREEQKAYRKKWKRQWQIDNPEKCKANTARYEAYKRKMNALESATGTITAIQ